MQILYMNRACHRHTRILALFGKEGGRRSLTGVWHSTFAENHHIPPCLMVMQAVRMEGDHH